MTSSRLMVVFLLVALTQVGCSGKSAPQPILIGHVAPFGGPDKIIGEHARQGILLAVEEANKEENRVAGRPVAVLHPRSDRQQLSSLAVRLIQVDRVAALLGGSNAVEAEDLGRAAQGYEVTVVTPAELAPQAATENVFSLNTGLAQQGHMLARFAVHELKADRVALLVDGGRAESAALAAAFAKEFFKEAGTSAKEWAYKSQTDLSDAIARMTKEPVRAAFHAGTVSDLKKTCAALDQAGITVPLLYGSDVAQAALLLADPDAAKGVYLGTVYVEEYGAPSNQEFVKKYRERFHETPDLHAALAYDGAHILFEALRRALRGDKALKLANLREQLANSKDDPFKSLTGSLTFDKVRSARRPLFIVRAEGGQFKLVKQYDPEADYGSSPQ